MQQFRILLALAAAFLVAPLSFAKPGCAAIPAGHETICARAIGAVERTSRMPPKLLDAISVVESGRWNAAKMENFAWPWTIYAQGKGRFFATKSAAVAAVRRLQAAGVESIDVGCMQVNLYHHPNAFGGLEEAFDPVKNVAYAAGFLNRLRRATRSWSMAVAHYHSSTRAFGRPYWLRVRTAWNDTLRRHYRERREAHVRAYRARRARRLAARRLAAR